MPWRTALYLGWVAALAFAQPTSAWGQAPEGTVPKVLSLASKPEPIDETQELEELDLVALLDMDVTTLATRTKLSSNDAPARIMSLSREQLQARGYRYLRDVFRDLPGYQASRLSDPDWDTTLVVRGLPGNNRIVFLLNGQRYSPPGGTPMPLFANLPIAFIERLEIMYGPGSALYGSDAFSGIINITMDGQDVPREVLGSVEYGSFGSVSGVTSAEVPTPYFTISVGAHYTLQQQPNLYDLYPNEYSYGADKTKLSDIDSDQVNLSRFDGQERGYDAYVALKREEFTLRYYQRGYSHSSAFGRNAGGFPVVRRARLKDLAQSVMASIDSRRAQRSSPRSVSTHATRFSPRRDSCRLSH